MSGDDRGGAARLTLRVVHGAPSDDELAALVAVLAAVGAPDAQPSTSDGPAPWSAPERGLRAPVWPSGWWASGLPR